MRKRMTRWAALGMAAAMVLTTAGYGLGGGTSGNNGGTTQGETTRAASTQADSGVSAGEPVTLKITWWGDQGRHDYTQELLDFYTRSHPDVRFEAMPSGWDSYFDKLTTQAASGTMPDIAQMGYLCISTYSGNSSLADLQPYVDGGTVEVSGIDENLLNSGMIDGKLTGMVLSSSYAVMGYNPAMLADAGIKEPDSSRALGEFASDVKVAKEKTGKYGAVAYSVVDDMNMFKYWVRQHGPDLFTDDNRSLGYAGDELHTDFLEMRMGLIDEGAVPNPDEHAQIQALGQEVGPVATGEGGFIYEWNNYASEVSVVNDKLKIVAPPILNGSDAKGLWPKPGTFFSIADTSRVKKEVAEFINWFMSSEEANSIMMAEGGILASSTVRDYMVNSGRLNDQQGAMFEAIESIRALCGEMPAPDPTGTSEINEVLKNIAYSIFCGQTSPEETAAKFRKDAGAILARSSQSGAS